MQDEIVDLEKLVTVIQIVVHPTQLEVIVTDHDCVALPWCVPTMQASSPSINPGTQQFTDGSQLC